MHQDNPIKTKAGFLEFNVAKNHLKKKKKNMYVTASTVHDALCSSTSNCFLQYTTTLTFGCIIEKQLQRDQRNGMFSWQPQGQLFV